MLGVEKEAVQESPKECVPQCESKNKDGGRMSIKTKISEIQTKGKKEG